MSNNDVNIYDPMNHFAIKYSNNNYDAEMKNMKND